MNIYLLRLLACFLIFLSFNANSSIYLINQVNINQIYSYTFDGPTNQDDSYFGAIPEIDNPIHGINRSVAYLNSNSGGNGYLSFDGEELLGLSLLFPDGQFLIRMPNAPSNDTTVDISGMSLVIGGPFYDAGTDINFDIAKSSNIAGNWSPLSSVTQQCVGAGCTAIPFLNLDFLGFTLEGTPTEFGGDDFILRGQTNNTSYVEISFSTVASPVPLPAGIYLFLSGLVGLGLMRGRNG